MTSKDGPIVDWLEIESSAPAKFIISGEYSVVYERQAIAAAVDLRTKVRIRPYQDKVRLNLKDLGVIFEWPVLSLSSIRFVYKYTECLAFTDTMPNQVDYLLSTKYCVSTSIEEPLKDKKISNAIVAFLLIYIGLSDSFWRSYRQSVDVTVESMIPVGSGLGSSSAYSVALCGALMKVFRVSAEKYIISNWALNIDKFFHGKPSGIDNNIVAMGGYILFHNGKIKESEISPPLRVLLIDTKVSRSTRVLCEKVEKRFEDEHQRISQIFDAINIITTHIWRTMANPNFDPHEIDDQLQENQYYLNQLGVGHEKLNDIFERARSVGLRSKQTGAGGGGTAFALYNEKDRTNAERLKEDLLKHGYGVHDIGVGCEGIKVKVTPDPDYK